VLGEVVPICGLSLLESGTRVLRSVARLARSGRRWVCGFGCARRL